MLPCSYVLAEHLAIEVRELDATRGAAVSGDILLYSHQDRGMLRRGIDDDAVDIAARPAAGAVCIIRTCA
jgi:hypothetical protein